MLPHPPPTLNLRPASAAGPRSALHPRCRPPCAAPPRELPPWLAARAAGRRLATDHPWPVGSSAEVRRLRPTPGRLAASTGTLREDWTGCGVDEHLRAALGGAYAIERELGGGGMARVFLAEEIALGRRVAIKVLAPELSGAVDAERFRREVRVAARLQHPHIVPVLTAGEVGGMLYYTMPFIEGESLRARLAHSAPFPLVELVCVMRDVARALACAHRHGVVHRDIKPENVLVDEGGDALVADFGIAKALSASASAVRTAAGLVLGTPAYISPEQAACDPAADQRGDLYSLGVVAYELLAGVHPYAGRSPQRLLAAHVLEPPVLVTKHRPDAPAPLAALVMHLLAKDPADRPQSADDVLHELDDPDVLPRCSTWSAWGESGRRWHHLVVAATQAASTLTRGAAWRASGSLPAASLAAGAHRARGWRVQLVTEYLAAYVGRSAAGNSS